MSDAIALRRAGPPAAWLPVAVLLFSASMWGLAWWPLKAFGEAGLSGPLLALLTYGAVGLAGLPWLWRERVAWRGQWHLVLLIAVLGGWGNAAFVSAIVLGDVARVMLLFYLAPVWSVLGGRLFLGEAVSRRRGVAVGMALAGAFLVVGGLAVFTSAPSAADLLADLLAVSAGIGFAGNNIVSRAAQAVPTASKTVALCLGCAAICALLLAAAGPGAAEWPEATPALLGALLAYSFAGLLLVTATWQWSVTRMEAGRSGVIAIAELAVALISATLLGAAVLGLREGIGALLIATAAAIEATANPSPPSPPSPLESA